MNRSKGFTLIELLVVIAIIGVLATLILLQLGIARAKARDAKRIADVSQLRTAIELYFDDNGGGYPAGALCAGTTCVGSNATNSGNDLTDFMSTKTLPLDPLNSNAYRYAWNNTNTKPAQFQIWQELERLNAPAFAADADILSNVGPWQGVPINGANEGAALCDSAVANDCVYDQGQQ